MNTMDESMWLDVLCCDAQLMQREVLLFRRENNFIKAYHQLNDVSPWGSLSQHSQRVHANH